MSCIQKTRMNGLKRCCNLFTAFFIFLCCINAIAAQQNIEFTEIALIDSQRYAWFGDVIDKKYPPEQAFDSDLKTCWVYGSNKSSLRPPIYLTFPFHGAKNPELNIFPGYGKTEKLFLENARPKKLRISLLVGINPEAYVSEIATIYLATEFPQAKTVLLKDSCSVQSIPLDFSMEDVADFIKSVHQHYDDTMEPPRTNTCLMLKIDVLETYPGTKYDDICITEIFYNDSLVSDRATTSASATDIKQKKIEKVYLNKAENTLLIDETDKKSLTVYSDPSSILQIMETSDDNTWAVLISMPAEIDSRAETTYLLADLTNKQVVNTQLEQYTGNYVSGSFMYFSSGYNESTYLNYIGSDFNEYKIELIR